MHSNRLKQLCTLSNTLKLALLIDILLCVFIIKRVRFTEVDFSTYLEHVRKFVLHGQTDYVKINGPSGPIVYPAGFLYSFYPLTFLSRFQSQIVFLGLYLASFGLNAPIVGKYAWMLLLSKRIHSIYLLRMFNDCVSMTLWFISLRFCLRSNYKLATVFFSLALSVKMNILLLLPAYALILLLQLGLAKSISHGFLFIVIQLLLGLPFISSHPANYFKIAFDFGRKFVYFWSVNWKFIPEYVFNDKVFHRTLLILHLTTLIIYASNWTRRVTRDTLVKTLKNTLISRSVPKFTISRTDKLDIFAVSSLLGILFARSLHYQFYTWYFWCIPYILRKQSLIVAIAVFLLIEAAWNTFPSTAVSSLMLFTGNLAL